MAYNLGLEKRIDAAIAGWGLAIPKKKMFAGIGYFINGNLVFGIHHDELIMRTNEELGRELSAKPGVRPFQMGNKKAMKNWYFAGGKQLDNLSPLLEMCRDFVLSLPPKT